MVVSFPWQGSSRLARRLLLKNVCPVMLASSSSVPPCMSSLRLARMREDMAQQHNHRSRICMFLNKYIQTDTQSVSQSVSEAVRADRAVCVLLLAQIHGTLQ